nr:hypothetical protein [Cressdnaviricota sp.]
MRLHAHRLTWIGIASTPKLRTASLDLHRTSRSQRSPEVLPPRIYRHIIRIRVRRITTRNRHRYTTTLHVEVQIPSHQLVEAPRLVPSDSHVRVVDSVTGIGQIGLCCPCTETDRPDVRILETGEGFERDHRAHTRDPIRCSNTPSPIGTMRSSPLSPDTSSTPEPGPTRNWHSLFILWGSKDYSRGGHAAALQQSVGGACRPPLAPCGVVLRTTGGYNGKAL